LKTAADWIGRELDRLSLTEQLALAGRWIGLEIYTPEKLPLRRIAAVGDSAADCIRQIAARGADPRAYEFRPYNRPYYLT
jgi:hypothetical protein